MANHRELPGRSWANSDQPYEAAPVRRHPKAFQMQSNTAFHKVALPDAWHPIPTEKHSDILSVITGRKLIVLCCTVIGLVLAIGYLAVTPRQYVASAEVLIDSRANPVSARDATLSLAPLEIAEVESQVELIKSSKIIASAVGALSPDVRDLLEAQQPSFVARLTSGVAGLVNSLFAAPPPEEAVGDDGLRGLVDTIGGGLVVRRVGSSYAVEILFSAQDPQVAASVANEVSTAYVRDQVQSKSDLWRGASTWMQQRLADLGTQASSASRISQEFKAKNQIVDTGNRGLVNEQQIQELNTALLEARAKTVEAASKMDEARKVLSNSQGGIVSDALSDGVVSKLREQSAELTQRESELESKFGPNHDAVIKTKADLKGVEASLYAEILRISQTLQSNYEVALARQKSLETSFKDQLNQSTVTSRAMVQAKEYDRTANAYDALYTSLLQRYTDAVNQQSFPIATAQVISRAVKPQAPSSPRRLLTLMLGLIAGAGLGVVAAFTRDATDQSLCNANQVERLGVPCYAMLPVLEREPDFKRRRLALASSTSVPSRHAGDKLKIEFLLHDPASMFAQAVQSIKTQLVMAGFAQDNRVIGVTSSRSGEGKSTIAANLALLFSHPDRRTLLIDADIFNPTLSRLLDVPADMGLSDVLTGQSSFDDAVVELAGSNLTVLTGGQAVAHADLLGSHHMRELLDTARQRFDRVIVDLPPVGEVVSTREVTPFLDGTVLVATWRKTQVSALEDTLKVFEFDRSKVFGVVLNKTAPGALAARHAYAAYQSRLRARATL